MCLNCGCMRAHDDMGKPGVNLTYEESSERPMQMGRPSIRRLRRSPERPRRIVRTTRRNTPHRAE